MIDWNKEVALIQVDGIKLSLDKLYKLIDINLTDEELTELVIELLANHNELHNTIKKWIEENL